MQPRHSAWALLRPVLLAAAAATSWIAISAGAASADPATSQDSLLGAAGSAASSVTSQVIGQAKDVVDPVRSGLGGGLAKAPAAAVSSLVPSPSLAPVVQDVTGLADHVVQSVPVVNAVVPAGTVSNVVDPAAGAVDTVVASTADAVAPVTEAVLVPLEPILTPVTGALPLPEGSPELPVVPDVAPATGDPAPPALPVPGVPSVVDTPAEGDLAPAVAAAGPSAGDAARVPAGDAAGRSSLLVGGLSGPPATSAVAASEDPADPAPANTPAGPLPPAPATTAGGAGSSGGNGPAVPAWISAHHVRVPAAGSAAVEGHLLAAPAPVSFDPGSSPD